MTFLDEYETFFIALFAVSFVSKGRFPVRKDRAISSLHANSFKKGVTFICARSTFNSSAIKLNASLNLIFIPFKINLSFFIFENISVLAI